MEKNNNKLLFFLLLQVSVIIFALSSVFSKLASSKDFLSKEYIIFYFISLVILGIYAIFWQQVIKHIDISIAYVNKATVIIWSMLFAYLIFNEQITFKNIIGIIVILLGIILVNKND